MNWFDLTVGILLLIAFINGYRKGLVIQLVGLATIILAAVFGSRFAKIILPELNRLIDLSPEVARVLSFILAFVAIAVGLSLIGRLLQRFIEAVFLSFINRLFGAIIAAGTMMVFLSIILNLVLILDSDKQVINRKIREEAFFFERVEAVVPAIIPYLNPQLRDDIVPEKYSIDSTYQQQHFSI
ncbi:CvpA family protein [Proteiniphilum sp. UBA5384]|uniref:CvpA family protein n=1 Tax=Proteiniphilum sp. UBA5384 TaxID=1947279 RepID=UPI0025F13E27|nr:CvpA family protein [Proteiniphilum sp. UBA5384]